MSEVFDPVTGLLDDEQRRARDLPRLTVVEGVHVEYFAVYPNGRCCSVTRDAAMLYCEKWKNEDDARIITKVVRTPLLVIGTMEQG